MYKYNVIPGTHYKYIVQKRNKLSRKKSFVLNLQAVNKGVLFFVYDTLTVN